VADRTVWIDECLSKRNGHLWIEEIDTMDIVARHPTPVFVISENQLRRNVRRFQKAFAAGWPDGPVRVLPAAKANWITAIQTILAQEACGCDVYSEGELAVALKAGFPHDLISVNGVPKAKDHFYHIGHGAASEFVDRPEAVPIGLDLTLLDGQRTEAHLKAVRSSAVAAKGGLIVDALRFGHGALVLGMNRHRGIGQLRSVSNT